MWPLWGRLRRPNEPNWICFIYFRPYLGIVPADPAIQTSTNMSWNAFGSNTTFAASFCDIKAPGVYNVDCELMPGYQKLITKSQSRHMAGKIAIWHLPGLRAQFKVISGSNTNVACEAVTSSGQGKIERRAESKPHESLRGLVWAFIPLPTAPNLFKPSKIGALKNIQRPHRRMHF